MLGFVCTHAQTTSLLSQTMRAHHVRVLHNYGCYNLLPLRARHLDKRMRMPDIATLLSLHRLQWARHVLRMDEARLPHRMLTCWIPLARPRGRPHLTFAQGLVKDLAYAGLNTRNWGALAADRKAWRTIINNLRSNEAKLIAFSST